MREGIGDEATRPFRGQVTRRSWVMVKVCAFYFKLNGKPLKNFKQRSNMV